MAGLVILLILLLGSFLGALSELLVGRRDDSILNQLVFHATARTWAKEGGEREGGGAPGRGRGKEDGGIQKSEDGEKANGGEPYIYYSTS